MAENIINVLTSNSDESNFVISRLRSWFKPGTRIPSVCILIGVRLLFLLLLKVVLELLLLLIESCCSSFNDSNPNLGFLVVGLPDKMFWPPPSSVEMSVSSENSLDSTFEASQSGVIPFWASFVREQSPSEFSPLVIGADTDLVVGEESPSPMPAWLSELTGQFLFEILMLYKPEIKISLN